MGLIGNWFKKQKKEQLKQVTKKADVVAPAKETKELKKETKSESTAPRATATVAGAKSYRVILRPLVTEKSAIGESENKYSFVVAQWATKLEIKQAVREIYGVTPVSINVINASGRRVRFGRHQGRRSDFKKAVVSLASGQSINLHKGV